MQDEIKPIVPTGLHAAVIAACDADEIRDILQPFSFEKHISCFSILNKIAKDCEKGTPRKGLFALLSVACWGQLQPWNKTYPYAPEWQMGGKRSLIPSDLVEQDVKLLVALFDKLPDGLLKGRIGDVIWLQRRFAKSEDPTRYALEAVREFSAFTIEEETWYAGAGLYYNRALEIAVQLSCKSEIEELKGRAKDALRAISAEMSPMIIPLAALLGQQGVFSKDDRDVPDKLVRIAETLFCCKGLQEQERAYGCLILAIRLYEQLGDRAANKTARQKLFDGYLAEADAIARDVADGGECYSARAEMLYEKALKLGCHNEVEHARILQQLAIVRKDIVKHMMVFKSDPIDLTPSVEAAKCAVMGLPDDVALIRFADLYTFSMDQVECHVNNMLQHHQLEFLFGKIIRDAQGRPIAKVPGLQSSDAGSYFAPEAIQAKKESVYNDLISFISQGAIYPAYLVLRKEHHYDRNVFFDLAKQSEFVSSEQCRGYAQAIWIGYEGDFDSATKLLAPLVESSVRHVLSSCGLRTDHLNPDGTVEDNGIGTLLTRTRGVEAVLPPELIFELNTLFASKYGLGIRHKVAHGKLTDAESGSFLQVYVWWLAFSMMVRVRRKATGAASDRSD